MDEIEKAALEGEIAILTDELIRTREQLIFFADEQDFWRTKYLREHSEHDNWDYAETACDMEKGKDNSA